MVRSVVSALAVVAGSMCIGGTAVADVDDDPDTCCRGGQAPGADPGAGAGASGGEGASVWSWVVGVPGGGVSRPSGVGSCSGWRPASEIDPSAQPSDVGAYKVDPDGVTAILYFRDCGGARQFVWIRQEPPEVIAEAALSDMVARLLAAPVPVTSPVGRVIVNVETWLAVADPGVESVSASIPGLSVTATAQVAATEWTVTAPGEAPEVFECVGVGAVWSPAVGDAVAPCGVTVERAVAGESLRVEVRVRWEVGWVASDGRTGTLDPVVSAGAVVELPVHEIQTVGTRG